jgi:hypothetical protein
VHKNMLTPKKRPRASRKDSEVYVFSGIHRPKNRRKKDNRH